MEITELSGQIQVKIHQYSNKFQLGLSKPETKFIRQMLFGILKSGSVQLSRIGRGLSEPITLKKTTERLGHHLGKAKLWEQISALTLQAQRYYLRRCRYVICDISDIRKTYARKMEGMCGIRDGSAHELGHGYWLCHVLGVDEGGNLIVPAYSELYSMDKETLSENDQILRAFGAVGPYVPKDAIHVMDRGGDRWRLLSALLSEDKHFIIRQRGDRHIYYRGQKLLVRDLGEQIRLRYRFDVYRRRRSRLVRVSYRAGAVPVRLRVGGKRLYLVLVVEPGKGSCWFLSHLDVGSCEAAAREVFEGYGHRWKIEELIRQTKMDYDLESICLQRYGALKTMNALFWAAVSFLYTRLESLSTDLLLHPLLSIVKKNRLRELCGFIYYKLALGVKLILARSRLYRELICPRQTDQLAFDFGDP
ncbi:hypothetical protein BVY01_04060 [bacterium I07]|nr:hypothetical protein BVY01_04060 [bacterium I07]